VLPNHFIITSSVAAFVGLAGYSPYSPAKAALRNLHDTLRSELDLYNFGKHGPDAVDNERPPLIKIHTIFPGTILSPGLKRENETKPGVTEMLEADDPQMTPEQVAKATIRELEKGKHMVTVNWLGKIIHAAGSMLSVRDGGIIDTLLSSTIQLATPFVNWDLEGKVKRWAKDKGYPQH
jgi:3-dehydrosphinganine reductase